MDMNGHIGELFTESTHQQAGSLRSQETGHIFNCKRMDTHIRKILSKFEVVVKTVFALAGVSNVTRVGHGTLHKSTSISGSIYTQFQVFKVVQRIKDTEHIHSRLLGLVTEFVNNIVGVVGVSNSIGTTEEHLEWNIRNLFSQLFKTIPGIFTKESHGNIEGGTTPHFQGECIGKCRIGGIGTIDKFLSTKTCGKERLMSITPGGIGNEKSLVFTDSLGKSLRTLLQKNVTHTSLLSRFGLEIGRENRLGNILQCRIHLGFVRTQFDGVTIDGKIGEVSDQTFRLLDLLHILLIGIGKIPLRLRS
mmetsp:Transcript_21716/g.28550  ORF Transcript_21716/g.28550 Transcript_21716/m.28550 type:complete len:305 (-) Transcript_21716:529-1443(-)